MHFAQNFSPFMPLHPLNMSPFVNANASAFYPNAPGAFYPHAPSNASPNPYATPSPTSSPSSKRKKRTFSHNAVPPRFQAQRAAKSPDREGSDSELAEPAPDGKHKKPKVLGSKVVWEIRRSGG